MDRELHPTPRAYFENKRQVPVRSRVVLTDIFHSPLGRWPKGTRGVVGFGEIGLGDLFNLEHQCPVQFYEDGTTMLTEAVIGVPWDILAWG